MLDCSEEIRFIHDAAGSDGGANKGKEYGSCSPSDSF
jgi:hypothetical protein